jgi:hypothetical protein
MAAFMLGPEAEAMVARLGGRSVGSTCRRRQRTSEAESDPLYGSQEVFVELSVVRSCINVYGL